MIRRARELAVTMPPPARQLALWLAMAIAAFAVLAAVDSLVSSTQLFKLNRELSEGIAVAVVFSGALLLVAAVLAARGGGALAAAIPRQRWYAVAALLAFMAVDELLAVHERLEEAIGIDWQVLYLPVIVLAGLAWAAFLLALERRPLGQMLWLGGAAGWVVAQLLEFVVTRATGETGAVAGAASTAEELLEMIGSSLLLLTIVVTQRPARLREVRGALAVAAALLAVLIAIALSTDEVTSGPDEDRETSGLGAGPTPSEATVWAVGDGANGSRAARRVASLVPADADRFLYLGDVYESATAREFRTNYAPVYGHLYAITSPVLGNHDWTSRETGYRPYWAPRAGGRPPYYYAFELAGWELVALNSEAEIAAGSPQLRWLREQLDEPGTCRLAFMHQPYFNAGQHGDVPELEPIWEALRGRAAILLSGHDHNMQRFRPIDGIVQLISGAGGHGRYVVDRDDDRLAFATDSEYGALELRLDPGRARLRFVTSDGETLDRHTLSCEPLEEAG